MATLYTHRSENIRKTFLLMSVFLIMLIALGWALSYAFDMIGILYAAVGMSIVMNLVAYWKSDSIALAMSGAKEMPRKSNEYVHRMIENLAITAGLPKPRIYIMDTSQINAFATGRNPQHAAVAITIGAIEKLENEELEGVLAHEMSHIGNRDILVSTVAVVLAGVIAITADIAIRALFWGGGGNSDNRNAMGMVIGIVAIILAPLAATLLRLAVSRQREHLADASGALLTRYPEGLASALEKIGHDQTPMHRAKNANAHLFLASPFKGKESKSFFTKLFMTHPPIEERIERLRDLKI